MKTLTFNNRVFQILSLIAIILFTAVLISNAQRRDRKKEKEIEKTFVSKKEFKGEKISSIKASSSVNVFVYQSSNTNGNYIEIKTEPKYMESVIATLTGDGELFLSLKKEKYRSNNRSNRDFVVNIDVYTTGFHSIKATGATDVDIMDSFTVENLELSTTSASDLTIRKPLMINQILNLTASGASDFSATNLSVEKGCSMQISGAGDVVIKDLTTKCPVNITASGANDVTISGNVLSDQYSTITVSSACDFNIGNLAINNADFSGSSASDSKINVKENLNISVGSVASLYYKGYPGLNLSIKNVSRSSTVKKY